MKCAHMYRLQMSIQNLVPQVTAELEMIEDVFAGAKGNKLKQLTWLKMDLKKWKNDERRWAAWHLKSSAGEWLNMNGKKQPVVAFEFDMRRLNKDYPKQFEPDFQIVKNKLPHQSLPLPKPEQKMV